AKLLRLKRYEQPPLGYFDNFLHEFHRRQRDELLRQPLWRICLERTHDFMFRLNVPSLTSYPAAIAAVLICAAVISLRIYQAPEFLFRLHFASISRLTLALIFFAATGLVWAQDLPTSSISRQVKDVFGHAARAVVKVHGVDEHSEISGTGFFVDPTGTLYTSY